MARTIVGLFNSFAEARNALDDLVREGFNRDDISIVSSESTWDSDRAAVLEQSSDAASGAAVGATTGAVVGGATGLIASLAGMTIPVVGPVFAAGPLVATLAGAGVGAVAGGLIGALVNVGVPEEEAVLYEEGVRRGGTLVSVRGEDIYSDRIANILNRHGAVDVQRRATEWRATSAGTYASSTALPGEESTRAKDVEGYGGYKGERRDYAYYEPDFRNNYKTDYGMGGDAYEEYAPAYRYGYDLSYDPRYRGRDWSAAETDIRSDWESRRPGTWDRFKNAIRYSWDRVTKY